MSQAGTSASASANANAESEFVSEEAEAATKKAKAADDAEAASRAEIEKEIARKILRMESEIESNIQATLESFDPWKATLPFRKAENMPESEVAALCTKEHHICDLDNDRMCIGCALYKRIIKSRDTFNVRARSDACDYVCTIAHSLIDPLLRDGKWLSPMDELSGNWFVYFPIVSVRARHDSLDPGPRTIIRRNRVRVFDSAKLLKRINLGAFESYICRKLSTYWHTSHGGVVFCLNELLDILAPITAPFESFSRLGIPHDTERCSPSCAACQEPPKQPCFIVTDALEVCGKKLCDLIRELQE